MRRGDVVTIADRCGDYSGKPRPGVVVQSHVFGALDSVAICPITSTDANSPLLRLRVEPSSLLPLSSISWIAVDKLSAVRRTWIGAVIGCLSQPDMQRLNGALAVLLGLA
jgi:mRNA interferase MazF